MLSNIWDIVLYKPLVNILAFLISIVPGGDVGVAIIVLTILVKVILYPLSQRAIVSQAKMNMLAPELNKPGVKLSHNLRDFRIPGIVFGEYPDSGAVIDLIGPDRICQLPPEIYILFNYLP